jgi:hypothetical protein
MSELFQEKVASRKLTNAGGHFPLEDRTCPEESDVKDHDQRSFDFLLIFFFQIPDSGFCCSLVVPLLRDAT